METKDKTIVICTIHQPNYLPYLGFFEKMDGKDVMILYDNTQFEKNGFQNRNKIRTKDGWIWLTVPVLQKADQLIRDVQIDNRTGWQRKHWMSIQSNYSKAPYFKDYEAPIRSIYEKFEWSKLSDLNMALIMTIKDLLGIKTKLISSSNIIYDLETKSTDALIELCKEVDATHYISGAGGEEYLEVDKFEKEGIKVIFQHYDHPEYKQTYAEFHPYMCILDLLFNHGPNSLNILRGIK